MSRGPGVLQRRVLEALAGYEMHPPPRPYNSLDPWCVPRETQAMVSRVRLGDYLTGKYVPVRVLLRDLKCNRCDMSRALKSLEVRNLIVRYDSMLHAAETRRRALWSSCKYAGLTGTYWLKRQQSALANS